MFGKAMAKSCLKILLNEPTKLLNILSNVSILLFCSKTNWLKVILYSFLRFILLRIIKVLKISINLSLLLSLMKISIFLCKNIITLSLDL